MASKIQKQLLNPSRVRRPPDIGFHGWIDDSFMTTQRGFRATRCCAIIFDNLKSAVVNGSGRNAHMHREFMALCGHFCLEPIACA